MGICWNGATLIVSFFDRLERRDDPFTGWLEAVRFVAFWGEIHYTKFIGRS